MVFLLMAATRELLLLFLTYNKSEQPCCILVFHVPRCILNFLIGEISCSPPVVLPPLLSLGIFLECCFKLPPLLCHGPAIIENTKLVSLFTIQIIRILFYACIYKCDLGGAGTICFQ